MLAFATVAALTLPDGVAQAQTQETHPAIETLQKAIQSFQKTYNGKNPVGALRQTILPHIDVNSIAATTIGPAWKNATNDQKTRYAAELIDTILRQHGRDMADIINGSAEFRKPRAIGNGSPPKVEISMRAVRDNGVPITMEFAMYQTAKGAWRVNGIKIEGISLAQHFRRQFADTLDEGGIEALIERLARENGRKGAALIVAPANKPA
jgi:phospholipid transport system substrate-binding protein